MYCGKETKLMLNQDKYRYKLSRLDHQVNWVTLFLLIFMLLLCLGCAFGTYAEILRTFQDSTYIEDTMSPASRSVLSFFTYFLLYNSIIPIALPVTLEISRALQMCCLKLDPKLRSKSGEPFKPLTSVIPEDLGNTSHIFTDKTGTLTANEMHFKGLSLISSFILIDDQDRLNVIEEEGENGLSTHPTVKHLDSVAPDRQSALKEYLYSLYHGRDKSQTGFLIHPNPQS